MEPGAFFLLVWPVTRCGYIEREPGSDNTSRHPAYSAGVTNPAPGTRSKAGSGSSNDEDFRSDQSYQTTVGARSTEAVNGLRLVAPYCGSIRTKFAPRFGGGTCPVHHLPPPDSPGRGGSEAGRKMRSMAETKGTR